MRIWRARAVEDDGEPVDEDMSDRARATDECGQQN
jgi:hypothetical protein